MARAVIQPNERGPSLWLSDVAVTDGTLVGQSMSPRPPQVAQEHGWSVLEWDPGMQAWWSRQNGRIAHGATYACRFGDEVRVFGPVSADDISTITATRAVRTMGPVRQSWGGALGGENFAPATEQATTQAMGDVLRGGMVVVDGSDDWHAPDYVRPQLLLTRYRLPVHAWWHTGMSGKTRSGAVLEQDVYRELQSRFQHDFGCRIDALPGLDPHMLDRPSCGCWPRDGVGIYR